MSDTAQQGIESAEPADAQAFDGTTSFSQVNDRLKEIVAAVEDDNMPLDDALTLFEEAVGLGMQASSLLEQDMATREGTSSNTDAESVDANDNDAVATGTAGAAQQGAAGSADTAADTSDASQQHTDGRFN